MTIAERKMFQNETDVEIICNSNKLLIRITTHEVNSVFTISKVGRIDFYFSTTVGNLFI